MPLCQNGDVRLEITVEDTNDAKEFATKDNDKLLSSRTPTNTANHWRGVEEWGPKPGSPNEYKKTAMSVDINSQVAQIFRRHDWYDSGLMHLYYMHTTVALRAGT